MFHQKLKCSLTPQTAALFLAIGLGQVTQAQFVVPSDDCPTIEMAIEKAYNGAEVRILAGTYTPAHTLDAEGKNIQFIGETDFLGNPLTIISGGHRQRIFNCRTGETSLTVYRNLVFADGYDGVAGGMFIENASPGIVNCAFVDNRSEFQAGALYTGSNVDMSIESTLFVRNRSSAGGAVHNRDGRVSYRNCTFLSNEADEGGALRTSNNFVSLENCSFVGNTCGLTGGAAELRYGSSLLYNCTFFDNEARDGGAVFNYWSESIFEQCDFDSNHASRSGGATVENSSEHAYYGTCSFKNNHAVHEGGGVVLWGDEAEFLGCIFEDNWTYGEGGAAILKNTHVDFMDTTIKGNEAIADGGAIALLEATADLLRVSIEDNDSSSTGGIHASASSSTTLWNSTVCDNTNDQIIGTWIDNGLNCVGIRCDQCNCPADLNLDGIVDGRDLVQIIGAWGNSGGAEDLNGDGLVDATDLTILIGSWGTCP